MIVRRTVSHRRQFLERAQARKAVFYKLGS